MNPQKRLYRSTKDRMFAGVCGGVAEYLEVDPTLVRLVFVALALLSSGAGFVLYVVLMLIVPEQPDEKPKRQFDEDEDLTAASSVKASIPVPDKNQDDPSI